MKSNTSDKSRQDEETIRRSFANRELPPISFHHDSILKKAGTSSLSTGKASGMIGQWQEILINSSDSIR
jgi:hypothetical protein